MMLKVYMTRGLPASGKSTWAKAEVAKNTNGIKRINRDDLRMMFDNGEWSGSREKFIVAAQSALILLALEKGKHVILDDCNLDQSNLARVEQLISGFIQKRKAEIEIVDFTHVTPEECIERDRKRAQYVGEKVIRRMHTRYLFKREPKPQADPNLPRAILVDVDGTLALQNGRSPYEFEKASEDILNGAVAKIVWDYRRDGRSGGHILIMTGREEKFRDVTEKWLYKHDIAFDRLWMRPTGDTRNDTLVKREIYDREIAGKFNVEYCLDDRDRIVALWRSLGLTCLQVDYGDF